MSETLRGIAARYAAGLRAAGRLAPSCNEQRLEVLRGVMRYGIALNAWAAELELAGRDFADVTCEEWERHMGRSSGACRKDLGQFGKEEYVVGYVCTHMAWLFPDLPRESSGVWAGRRLDESALPDVISQFPSLPGAVDYLP